MEKLSPPKELVRIYSVFAGNCREAHTAVLGFLHHGPLFFRQKADELQDLQDPISQSGVERHGGTFNKTFKRDYVHMIPLNDTRTTMEQQSKWFQDYRDNHPHKSLKMRSPTGFRKQ